MTEEAWLPWWRGGDRTEAKGRGRPLRRVEGHLDAGCGRGGWVRGCRPRARRRRRWACRLRQRHDGDPVGYASDTTRRGRWRSRPLGRSVSSYETACQPLLVGLRLSGFCCARCGGCGVAGGRGGLASRRHAARLRGPPGAGRGPGLVGAACRGVVVAVATARLIFACRGRRSAARRTLPLTTREIRLAHN